MLHVQGRLKNLPVPDGCLLDKDWIEVHQEAANCAARVGVSQTVLRAAMVVSQELQGPPLFSLTHGSFSFISASTGANRNEDGYSSAREALSNMTGVLQALAIAHIFAVILQQFFS
eukprot:532043-Amphidinium_carterae.1